MEFILRIPLNTSEIQAKRLKELQKGFTQLCNALAPIVQSTRIWNRVALHHLAYRDLRQQYPAMGSQMVCNAIYSVSRTCKQVFQNPRSPFHLDKLGSQRLPLLRFDDNCPVYFDRHTLSLKAGQLSMFTLDGRMKFELPLAPDIEQRFHSQKLKEVMLQRRKNGCFELTFSLSQQLDSPTQEPADNSNAAYNSKAELPEYVFVDETV